MEKKLIEFDNEKVFYCGTIIVLKNLNKSYIGNPDIKYAIVADSSGSLKMLDLYRFIGSIMFMGDIEPIVHQNTNIKHLGVDKRGILNWVKKYIEFYLNYNKQDTTFDDLSDIVYIDHLENHFEGHLKSMITISDSKQIVHNFDDTPKKLDAYYNADIENELINQYFDDNFPENTEEMEILIKLQDYFNSVSNEELIKDIEHIDKLGKEYDPM